MFKEREVQPAKESFFFQNRLVENVGFGRPGVQFVFSEEMVLY